jgi:hypothetical protein
MAARIRSSQPCHDPLHARALVLDDGSTRLAFVVVGQLPVAAKRLRRAKELIRQATQLAPERVCIFGDAHAFRGIGGERAFVEADTDYAAWFRAG